jgi:RNA polymerase sigma factor (sigma-70 family)
MAANFGYRNIATMRGGDCGTRIRTEAVIVSDETRNVGRIDCVSMHDPKKAFIERLFARNRDALQAFFYRRIRTKADAADLAQEVYLRMLRVSDTDAVRNPEAYLFTVAGNLLKENAVVDRRQATATDLDDMDAAAQLADWPGADASVDTAQRVVRLREVLRQLPPKCCAALVLQYRYQLSYEEIAERLGVSPHMVKKYLAQALAHCRRRMARLG